ncbi:MAG: hypothetical protein JW932_08395 [Deltaproteobacteria bacterium]|nr:hypothetical protein [Deltaproteobacteria bacterium]
MEGTKNYQLSTSVNEGILEIVFAGEVTKNTVENIHTDAITIIREQTPRAILSDIRALNGRYEDFIEAFFRTREMPQHVKTIPSVVVDTSKNKAFQSFYETTAANVGITIKWFHEIEPARAWLKSKIQE